MMGTDDDTLVEELARVVSDPEGAVALVMRIGVLPQHVPDFRTASSFWRSVVQAAHDGELTGGTGAIARAAAEIFPDNEVFGRYAAPHGGAVQSYRDRAQSVENLAAQEPTAQPWPGEGVDRRDATHRESPRSTFLDVGHDDHLWDTGGAASLGVLGRRVPVITRGSTIIVGGRVRHKQRPVARCPECHGPLQPVSVSVRFELAPDATAVQELPGYRCEACGSEWPEPSAMRMAHTTAFGLSAAQRGTVEADPETTSDRNELWDAPQALGRILHNPPSILVWALDMAVAGARPREAGQVERVIAKIDALGRGSRAALSLLRACDEALVTVARQQPRELPHASMTVRTLLSEWLPRRYGGGSRVKRLKLWGYDGDAYPDLEVATYSRVVTEIDVASVDGRALDLVTVEGTLMGRCSLPVPSSLDGVFDGVPSRVDEIADELATRFVAQSAHRDEVGYLVEPHKRAWMRAVLAHRGEHYYLAMKKENVPVRVLEGLKTIYPPLRLVLLTPTRSSEADDERMVEARIHRVFGDTHRV